MALSLLAYVGTMVAVLAVVVSTMLGLFGSSPQINNHSSSLRPLPMIGAASASEAKETTGKKYEWGPAVD